MTSEEEKTEYTGKGELAEWGTLKRVHQEAGCLLETLVLAVLFFGTVFAIQHTEWVLPVLIVAVGLPLAILIPLAVIAVLASAVIAILEKLTGREIIAKKEEDSGSEFTEDGEQGAVRDEYVRDDRDRREDR